MASINGLSKLGLPKLSENMDPQDARALRNYLYQMQEQLQYVLSNLDTENLSEELGAKLRGLQ
nr:MAG TPA_asm: Nuclear pore complex protein [Caudoviricetes sp.]